MLRIEHANTDHIAALLAPPPASPGPVLNPRPLAVVTTISSGSSNSVTGPLRQGNEEDHEWILPMFTLVLRIISA